MKSEEDIYVEGAMDIENEAIDTFELAVRELALQKATVRGRREQIELLEADAIVNGEAVGKNEQERKAALVVYLAALPAWVNTAAELRKAETRVLELEAEVAVAEQRLRVYRSQRDWYTSVNYRAATLTKER